MSISCLELHSGCGLGASAIIAQLIYWARHYINIRSSFSGSLVLEMTPACSKTRSIGVLGVFGSLVPRQHRLQREGLAARLGANGHPLTDGIL